MGEKTLNNYFYKPALGASGVVEKGKFDDALDVADAQIEANKDGISGVHIQGTDQGLDDGGENAVVVADVKDAVTKKHEHSNKTELDKLTDGDHDVRTDNPHTVTKTQVSLGNVENLKVNLEATEDPDKDNDVSEGYTVGSRWFNITLKTEWVCLDNSDGAAVWTETTGAGGGGASTFLELDDTPDEYEAGKYAKVNAEGTALEFDTPAGGGDALTTDPLSQFAATTSTELAGVISDKTGSGALNFGPPGFASGAKGYKLAADQVIANNTVTKVVLEEEEFDVLGEFDKTTNYRFTATVAGYYLFVGQCFYTVAVNTKMYQAKIYVNGVNVQTHIIIANGTSYAIPAATGVTYLAANGYIELYTYQSSGANANLTLGQAATFLIVKRLY